MTDPPAKPVPRAADLADFITLAEVEALVRTAHREDMGAQGEDLTSALLIPAQATGRALVRSRAAGYLAGVALLPVITRVYDSGVSVETLKTDGQAVAGGDTIARLRGPLRSMLALERVALNFLTLLSGVATLTAGYVGQVAHTRAHICDTRKTIPGLRALQKYAVVCGGGTSHRMGLFDAVLIKDNHIAHVDPDELAAFMVAAVRKARTGAGGGRPPRFVQVEVDSLPQLEAVLAARPDIVLLDNMSVAHLAGAVDMRGRMAPAVLLEASGGINLQNVRAVAETGVDRISVGALTHSAPSLDLGLDIEVPPGAGGGRRT